MLRKMRLVSHMTVLIYIPVVIRLTLWDAYECHIGLPTIQCWTQMNWKLKLPEQTSETEDLVVDNLHNLGMKMVT